jgi:DNA-binding transcriptional ArsR family regulator
VLGCADGLTSNPRRPLDVLALTRILSHVPKYSAQTDGDAELDLIFRALADGTRRAMVARLVHGPAAVSQLAEPFGMALPTVVQHLRVLEEAQIVSSEKVGRVRTYQLVPDALVPANVWIVAHRRPHERQLDRLGDHLANHHPKQEY